MAAVQSTQGAQDDAESEEDRWPLLPENDLRPGTAPYTAAAIVRFEDAEVRRGAIAITTRIDVLRQIPAEEARLHTTRWEMVAMANQQKNRVETVGLAEGDYAAE